MFTSFSHFEQDDLNKAILVPAPGIFLASFGDTIIALDLNRDRYSSVSTKESCAIRWALNPIDYAFPLDVGSSLDSLIKSGLLVESVGNVPVVYLPEAAEQGGVEVRMWQPHLSEFLNDGISGSFPLVLSALYFLARVSYLFKRRGMQKTIAYVMSRRARVIPCEVEDKLLGDLVEAHIRARMIFPKKIECLIGSTALALHAYANRIPIDFVVGVQKYPFYAHAWVEYQKKILNDSPEIARKLAPILTIN